MEILLGYFNAKREKEDIFKPIKRNEILREISNDNVITVQYFATKNYNCQEYNASQHS